MKYLADRNLFIASILAASASIGCKYIGESHAASGALRLARATQDLPDERNETVSPSILRQAIADTTSADSWRLASITLLVVGMIALTVSVRRCEPGWRVIPVLLLATAAASQLVIV